jgi:hypothetical protein
MDNGRTSLDMETKVALMAALLYDGREMEADDAVAIAIGIEQEAHKQVASLFRERKLARSE